MDNPTAFQLTQNGGAFQIAADGLLIGDVLCDILGLTAVSLLFAFAYGSGGTALLAYLQTSLDQGMSWFDIAAPSFATASTKKLINLSGLTPVTTPLVPQYCSLAADTCVDGILGDRLRVVTSASGGYAGSQLNVTGVMR